MFFKVLFKFDILNICHVRQTFTARYGVDKFRMNYRFVFFVFQEAENDSKFLLKTGKTEIFMDAICYKKIMYIKYVRQS